MNNQIKERCIYCGADVYYNGSEQLIKCGMCGHTLVVAKFENEIAKMNAALKEGEAAKRALEEAEKEKQAVGDRLLGTLSDLDQIRDEQDILGRLMHTLAENQDDAAGRLVFLQNLSERMLKAQDNVFEKMSVMQEIAAQLQRVEMDGHEREALMNDFMIWSQQAHQEDLSRLQKIAASTADLLEGQKAIDEKIISLKAAADRHQKTLEAFQGQYTQDRLKELRQLYRQGENFQHDWRFDRAETCYCKALTKGGDDAEIFWRLLLCHYCIVYQQDDEGRMIPIILNPDLSDPEQMSVRQDLSGQMADLPADKRDVYAQELEKIDRILDKYREVRHQVNFDVFISVKQSLNGHYSKDSDVASTLYDFLTKKGLKVFNSRRTPIPAGQEFEPYIISALISSKVLIVVGSSPENMNAQWVRNEWSRFQWMQKREKQQAGKTQRKLFCYLTGDMQPNQIPKALNPNRQAIVDGVMANEQLMETLTPLFKPVTKAQETGTSGSGIKTPDVSVEQVLDQMSVWLTLGMYDNVLEKYDELMEKGLHMGTVMVHLNALCAKYQVEDTRALALVEADLSKEKILKAAKVACRSPEAQTLIKDLLEKKKSAKEPQKPKKESGRRKKKADAVNTASEGSASAVSEAETETADDKAAGLYQRGKKALKEEDYAAAYRFFRDAAKAGHVQAMYETAQLLMEGKGIRLNRVQAFKWYQTIAETGDAGAWMILAHNYEFGIGVRKNVQELVACYQKAADLGNADAQYEYAGRLLEGRDIDKDEKAAFSYFKKAAEQGHARAQTQTAKMYAEGVGTRKNKKSAANWFLKAAEQGEAEAQCCIGVRYLYGEGVGKNPEEAVEWFRKAAENNHGDACYQLSKCLEEGTGTEADDKEAVRYLKLAADKNHARARYELAKRYETGNGVKQSPNQAFTWMRKVAYPDFPEAENAIGEYYERGFGTVKNKDYARHCYEIAMNAGYAPARLNYERVKKRFFGLF